MREEQEWMKLSKPHIWRERAKSDNTEEKKIEHLHH